MRARSNAHTHTAFSDGRDTPRQQVERALALGFRSLGFSDHAVQEVDAFTGMPKEREADYQSAVRAGGGIRRPRPRLSRRGAGQ